MMEFEPAATPRLDLVVELVQARVERNQKFSVHPPELVRDEPKLLERDDFLRQLMPTMWAVSFEDGRRETLSFVEILLLTQQIVAVAQHLERHTDEQELLELPLPYDLDEILSPDYARALLNALAIEPA